MDIITVIMIKLVKEHINEVFTQNSDPIRDLGIGHDIKTLEGYLKINGYKIINRNNTSFGFGITFEKNKKRFILTILKKEIVTTIRFNVGTLLIIPITTRILPKPIAAKMFKTKDISEENLVAILKKMLNKYYKNKIL